jgi:hypothetical protein
MHYIPSCRALSRFRFELSHALRCDQCYILQKPPQAGSRGKQRAPPAVPPQIRNVRRELQTASQLGRPRAPRRSAPAPAAPPQTPAARAADGGAAHLQQEARERHGHAAAARRMSLPAEPAAGAGEAAARRGAKRRLSMSATPRRPNEYGSASGDPYG